jgi:hypothetical protein
VSATPLVLVLVVVLVLELGAVPSELARMQDPVSQSPDRGQRGALLNAPVTADNNFKLERICVVTLKAAALRGRGRRRVRLRANRSPPAAYRLPLTAYDSPFTAYLPGIAKR